MLTRPVQNHRRPPSHTSTVFRRRPARRCRVLTRAEEPRLVIVARASRRKLRLLRSISYSFLRTSRRDRAISFLRSFSSAKWTYLMYATSVVGLSENFRNY